MKSIRQALAVVMTLAVLLAPPLRAQAHANAGHGHGAAMIDGHGLGADHHGYSMMTRMRPPPPRTDSHARK